MRTKESVKPADVLAYLKSKQVRDLYVFCASDETAIPGNDQSAPQVVASPSYVPEVMGLPGHCN